MNKKLKVISSVLCGVLISSSLATTGVYAKTRTNDNFIKVDSAINKKLITVQPSYIDNMQPISISDDKIVFELKKLSFTKDEIYDLYKMEANRLNSSVELPNLLKSDFGKYVYPELSKNHRSRRSLPNNPKPGTYYNAYFNINFKSLAEDLMAMGCAGSLSNIPALIGSAPKSLLAKAVVKYMGIGAIAVAGVGGILFFIDKYAVDAKGISGYQTWYYGEDNNGGIGWTPGYINAKPYY